MIAASVVGLIVVQTRSGSASTIWVMIAALVRVGVVRRRRRDLAGAVVDDLEPELPRRPSVAPAAPSPPYSPGNEISATVCTSRLLFSHSMPFIDSKQ